MTPLSCDLDPLVNWFFCLADCQWRSLEHLYITNKSTHRAKLPAWSAWLGSLGEPSFVHRLPLWLFLELPLQKASGYGYLYDRHSLFWVSSVQILSPLSTVCVDYGEYSTTRLFNWISSLMKLNGWRTEVSSSSNNDKEAEWFFFSKPCLSFPKKTDD